MSYTHKIDQLLSVATQLGFTEQDFAELAIAAADQSGATPTEQVLIMKILGVPAGVFGTETMEAVQAFQEKLDPDGGLKTRDVSLDIRGRDMLAFQRLWNRANPGDAVAEDGLRGPRTEARQRSASAERWDEAPCAPVAGPCPRCARDGKVLNACQHQLPNALGYVVASFDVLDDGQIKESL